MSLLSQKANLSCQSIDFDFFSDRLFRNQEVSSHLRHVGHFDLFEEARNAVHGSLNSVKISFLYHLLKSLTYFDDAEQEPMPKMVTLVE